MLGNRETAGINSSVTTAHIPLALLATTTRLTLKAMLFLLFSCCFLFLPMLLPHLLGNVYATSFHAHPIVPEGRTRLRCFVSFSLVGETGKNGAQYLAVDLDGLGVDHDGGHDRRDRALIDPSVQPSAVEQDVAGFEMDDLATV